MNIKGANLNCGCKGLHPAFAQCLLSSYDCDSNVLYRDDLENTAAPSIWKLLALDDVTLERYDLIAANLAVARGVESLANIDVRSYCETIDNWTSQLKRWLPSVERHFRTSPAAFKNDIGFFRAGMVQCFLSNEIGMEYKSEDRQAKEIQYTDPSDLFVNGVIDTRRGTCGNMAVLHVAVCRRMGWPVTLACVKNHQLSRYEASSVVVNIECTMKVPNGFSAGSDEEYLKRFGLPERARACGSDLRRLSMREMLGVFVGARARHYQDVGRMDLCDVECSLARALLPTRRPLYQMAMLPYVERGKQLFEPDELG